LTQSIHELHLFQHELLDAFIQSFQDALEGVAGISLDIDAGVTRYSQEFSPPFPCIAQLDYTGSSVGFLALCSKEDVFTSILDLREWTDSSRGMLKEILNTSSGLLLSFLKQICPVVTLLSPKIIEGKVDYPKVRCLSRQVQTAQGILYFAVVIDQRALDIDIVLRETIEVKERLQATQKELVQAEKMASLGELVAGVAHEVNTPLGVGITATSHLAEQISAVSQKFYDEKMKKSDLYNFLKNSEEEIRLIYGNLIRASQLIQSFKKVAADQSSEEMRVFAIVPYLREVVSSLIHLTKDAQIRVSIVGDEGLTVASYPGVYSQMVTHFLSNAVSHAFDGRASGELRISVESNQNQLVLKFIDNGLGMSPEVCKKVFDPFFTTKRGRGGTGLGLHIIYNSVVQRLKGSIHCVSQENVGTEFIIICPLGALER
jgi:signal transduction histidine kinase